MPSAIVKTRAQIDGCDFFEQRTFLVLSCHRDIATAPVGIEPYQGRPAQLWHQGRKHVLASAQQHIDVRVRRQSLPGRVAKLPVSLYGDDALKVLDCPQGRVGQVGSGLDKIRRCCLVSQPKR